MKSCRSLPLLERAVWPFSLCSNVADCFDLIKYGGYGKNKLKKKNIKKKISNFEYRERTMVDLKTFFFFSISSTIDCFHFSSFHDFLDIYYFSC
jgi:hypothetical protein